MKDEQIDSIEVDVSLYFLNLQQRFPLNFYSYHYQVYRIILVESSCLLLVFTWNGGKQTIKKSKNKKIPQLTGSKHNPQR